MPRRSNAKETRAAGGACVTRMITNKHFAGGQVVSKKKKKRMTADRRPYNFSKKTNG